MEYEKQTFVSGHVLLASELNAINDQVAANVDGINQVEAKVSNLETNYTQLNANISGFASEVWVTSQGYLTEQDLSTYATQEWVESKGYLTTVSDEYYKKSEVDALIASLTTRIAALENPVEEPTEGEA